MPGILKATRFIAWVVDATKAHRATGVPVDERTSAVSQRKQAFMLIYERVTEVRWTKAGRAKEAHYTEIHICRPGNKTGSSMEKLEDVRCEHTVDLPQGGCSGERGRR